MHRRSRSFIFTGLVAALLVAGACNKPAGPTEHNMFMVIAKSGLNLRQGPDIKTPRLSTLPYGTVGSIQKKEPGLVTLQGRSGFWFRTEIGGKQGYMFSGFVVLGASQSDMEAARERLEAAMLFRTGGFSAEKPPSHVRIVRLEGAELYSDPDLKERAGEAPFGQFLPVRALRASGENTFLVNAELAGKSVWLRSTQAFPSKAENEPHYSEKYPPVRISAVDLQPKAKIHEALTDGKTGQLMRGGKDRQIAGFKLIPIKKDDYYEHLLLEYKERAVFLEDTSWAPKAEFGSTVVLKYVTMPGTCGAALHVLLLKTHDQDLYRIELPNPGKAYCSATHGSEPTVELRISADGLKVMGKIEYPLCVSDAGGEGPAGAESKQVGWDARKFFAVDLSGKPTVEVLQDIPPSAASAWSTATPMPEMSFK